MGIIGSILTIILGIFVLVFTSHIVFTILGWAAIVIGIIWTFRNLKAGNRTDL